MSKKETSSIIEALVSELVKLDTAYGRAKKNRPAAERRASKAGSSQKLLPLALVAELRFKPLIGELVWFAKANRPWVGGRLLMVDVSNRRAPALVLRVGNTPNPDADPEGALEVRVPMRGTRFEDREEHYTRLADGVAKDIQGMQKAMRTLDAELLPQAEKQLQRKINKREELLALRFPVHC